MSLPQTTEEKKTTIDTGDTGSNAVAPLAKEIIDKKLEEANHITELDSSLGAIKKEIEHKSSSKHIETIPENMTIAQAVEQFFAEQQNNTLDQLEKNDKNEVGLLATDLAVYQCIVSVIDHIMTQILAKNPSISPADMQKTLSTIMSQISDISMLQHTIANPPSINNIAITGPISLDADETAVLKLLSSQTPLSQDYHTGHGTDLSHYGQVLSLVDQGMKTKIEEHYSIIAQAKNKIGQIGDEITTTATGVSATVSEKVGQARERGKQNKNTLGAVALGGVAVYGIYKFVNWMSSDDTPTAIAEDGEHNTDSTTYNQHMKDGYTLYTQGKYAEAKKQFEAASLLLVSDNQAGKRIEKCESKTGTTGLWKSKLGTFLKWAAGIGIVGGSIYALYKWRNGDSMEKQPDIPKAIDNVESQIKKFEHLTPEEQAIYNTIGESINNTYTQINRFPGESDGSPASNEDPLGSYGEFKLGTGTDKYPGVIPYIYNGYENIGQIVNSDQIFNMIIHADINQMEEVIKDLIADGAEYIVAGIAQATGFDRIAGQGTKFVNRIKEGNNSQTIKTVCRKLIKGMSWLHLIQRHQVGSQLMDSIKKGNASIIKGTANITIPQDDAKLHTLINNMLSDPTSYSLNGKTVQEYIDEFQKQSIKDLDMTQIKSISHEQLMIYNQETQNVVNNINEDRNQIHTDCIEKGAEKTLDYLIGNIGKDISNGVVDGIGHYITNNTQALAQYIPFAGAVSGLKACFDQGRAEIVQQLMNDQAGFKEILDAQTQKLQSLKGKTPKEISRGIDEYFATLKELRTGEKVLFNINQSEKDGSYILSLTNGLMSVYNTTKEQIFSGIEMMFDPDASVWTKGKGFVKTYANLSIPAMLRGPTRSLYLKSLKLGLNKGKRAGNMVFEGVKSHLPKIRNPRVPASVTNQQIAAVDGVNNVLNTHPRITQVAKDAQKFASFEQSITQALGSNAQVSDDFLKLGNILAKDTKLAGQLKLCKDINAIESLLEANKLRTKEMRAVFETLGSSNLSHTGDDLVKFVDHIGHFPLKSQIKTWMKIPGMNVLNGPIAQTMLKVVGVAGGVLEAITTRQSYRASQEEIKAMETENQQLADIMANEQWANLVAGGASAGLAIASAIAGGPAGLVLLAGYVGMQGVKVGIDTYYDVMKFYNLNTSNYLKQNTGFIKSAIVSTQSWNQGINIGFKDAFQSFVSMLPIGTEDFCGLTKMNQGEWTARQAMIALLTLDEITRKPDIDQEKLHTNVGIRIAYVDNTYLTGLTQQELQNGTEAFNKIDQIIKESHQDQVAKSSDFQCKKDELKQKYEAKLNERCDGGVENLNKIYTKSPMELHKMYVLCQSPYFDTLINSKQNPQTKQTLQANKAYLINYRNYKNLDTAMEDFPSTMLGATEDLVQFEEFLLYNFTNLSKQTYTKEEAQSILAHSQYQGYDLQTNATLYGASGKPGQDLLYQYAKYLGYGISSDPQGSQGSNTLEGLKQFFAYENDVDDGMSNQDKKGIYRDAINATRGIQKVLPDTFFDDKALENVQILETIATQSGNMIDTPNGSGENRINQAYQAKIKKLATQITEKYNSSDQTIAKITSYVQSKVKSDGSEFVELPSDMIASAMKSGCGNVQPYLYGFKDNKLYGLVSQQHFGNHSDPLNLTNKLIDTNYEIVSTAQTSSQTIPTEDKILGQ